MCIYIYIYIHTPPSFGCGCGQRVKLAILNIDECEFSRAKHHCNGLAKSRCPSPSYSSSERESLRGLSFTSLKIVYVITDAKLVPHGVVGTQ